VFFISHFTEEEYNEIAFRVLIAISSFKSAAERKMSRYIQVVTTVDRKEDATRIAQALVEKQGAVSK
jgi:hypothetical protein